MKKNRKTDSLQGAEETGKKNDWAAVVVGWFVGFVVLVSYLGIGASPESSYVEWGAFFCGITVSLIVVRLIYDQSIEFLILMPLFIWNCFWAVVQALRGKICGSCLTVLSGCVVLLVAIHFAFKFFRKGSEK